MSKLIVFAGMYDMRSKTKSPEKRTQVFDTALELSMF